MKNQTLDVKTLRYVTLGDFPQNLRGTVQDIMEPFQDNRDMETVGECFLDATTIQELCIDPEANPEEMGQTLDNIRAVVALLREHDCQLSLLAND